MIMLKINKEIKQAKEKYEELVMEEMKKINAFIKEGDVCVLVKNGGNIRYCGFFHGGRVDRNEEGDLVCEVNITNMARGDNGAVCLSSTNIDDIISITKYE